MNTQQEMRKHSAGFAQGKIRKPEHGSIRRDVGVTKSNIFLCDLGAVPQRIDLKCEGKEV